MFKRLLFVFIGAVLVTFLKAQTLYWVGGSGYWNDYQHWSYTSGGKPAGVVPNSVTNVIFDELSAFSSSTIHVLQSTQVHSIQSSATSAIELIGSPNVNFTITGDVQWNEKLKFNINGKLTLAPKANATYQFSHNKFKNPIVVNSIYDVSLGALNSLGTVTLNGKFTLKNTIILTQNLVLDHANISLENVTMQAENTLSLQGTILSANPSKTNRLITNKNKLSPAQKDQIDGIAGLKFGNISSQACVVTLAGSSNPTCFGLCDGTATFDLSGCTNSPYIIQWLNPDPSASCQTLPPVELAWPSATYSVNTLCGCGTQYSVLFENSLGEQFAVQFSVANPAATLLTFSSTQPSCNGVCDGQIRANVVSGVTPMSINWNAPNVTHSNIVTKDTLKLACAGAHTVTTTNANGCVNTFTAILSQPAAISPNGTKTNIICGGSCTGSATVSPSGGTAPYGVTAWSNASTGNSVSSLCAGAITATVTDSKGCIATYSTTITEPPTLTLSINSNSLSCANVCDGSATLTVSGGQTPYTYTWSAPAVSSTSVVSNLCSGTYSVNMTDNLGCLKTQTVSIAAPPTLTTAPTSTNVTCFGASTGSININPSGGVPSYTYNWSPAVSSASVANGVPAGTYNYTVTDSKGCVTTQSLVITQPVALSHTVSGTNVTCFGACDGTGGVTVAGGTSPYTYSWSPGNPTGQGTTNITALCPGTYSVLMTDANNCTRTGTVSITQPTALSLSTTSHNLSCNGVCDGSISATPSGGTPGYSYTLQPSSGAAITTAPPYTSLCADSYTLTMKDAAGCTTTKTITISQPNPITLTLTATAINCFGQCNASIATAVGGGSPSYTYNWNTGSTASSLSNQCAGAYNATVTDAGGCKATASVTIASPTDMTVSVTSANPKCSGTCNGSASASVNGGTPNYTYSWTPTGSTTASSSGLCSGTYTVRVTDSKGCIKTQTTSLVAPPALTLATSNGTTSCSGVCNGTVGVTPSGGTAGYSYSWSSGAAPTASVNTGLCAGNYAVTVTDANGCIASNNATVSQPTALTTTITNVQSSCNICIGAATAGPSGGTSPYSYSWVNSSSVVTNTTQTASNMCVGDYTLTVTDKSGCTTTQTVNIAQTVLLVLTSNGNTLSCNGSCSGIGVANASGGSGSYTYSWTTAPAQLSQTANGLCAGIYSVIVTDATSGCSSTGTLSFSNPPAISISLTPSDLTCNSLCNGSITTTASGGTGALTYQWLPGGQTTANITNLCAGTYTLIVTDGNGCTASQTTTINEPTTLSATFNPTSPSTCISSDGSISITPTGGTAPYSFTWTPGGSINPLTNLAAGTYSAIVSDANGCSQTVVTTLSNPAGPTVTVSSSSVTCFGLCNASATATASGISPFIYSWNSGSTPTSSTTAGLCSGNVAIQVTDGNGCITSQTVSISQPTALSASGVVTNVKCNAACTGSIDLTPSGGTSPYSYSWSPAGSGQDPTGLCANNYSCVVTDANGCTTTSTFVITEPIALSLSFNKKDVLCNGNCNGAVRAVVSGGTSPYVYTWTPAGTFPGSVIDTIINLCSGVYSVSVQDANGCVITGTVDITEPPALASTVTVKNAKCNGLCDGQAIMNPSGGTAPYSYNWNVVPVSHMQTVTSLCPGNYLGTVVDANGCSSTNAFTISQPAAITITATSTNPKCNGVCNGSVTTSVAGGNPNYSYQWIPYGGSSSSATGLCAGIFTINVTDDSLCTGQTVVTLTEPAVLLANASSVDPTCNGSCDGSATAIPVGGTAPYSYAWLSPAQSTQTAINLCAGDYTVTVTDANSCSDTQTLTLSDPAPVSVNPSSSPATCGVSNGTITLTPVTGNAPYSYNWLAPAVSSTSVATNLAAGIYTVIVTDATSCTATISIPLSNSNGPTGVTTTYTDVTCNGLCDGVAEVSNPVGGTPGYTLSWVTPVTTNTTITNLCAGTYTAQVQDANNCLLFQSVVISEPQSIADNSTLTGASCFGHCDGMIELAPTGGNGGYTYSWSNSATTQTVTNLCPGNISVTITDSKGCTLNTVYNLPSLVTIASNTFATNNICNGDCNGTLQVVNVAGGLPPYTYLWTDPFGQITPQAVSLCSGTYSVVITDANGCFGTVPGAVSSPSVISPNPIITQPTCGQCDGVATLNPTGGNGGFSYEWSNTQTTNPATNLCAGVYDVQITDSLGCITNTNVVVNSTTSMTTSISQTDETCAGTCNGTASVTVTGGTTPYTYHWVHDNSTNDNVSSLCAGIYFCNITDAAGCITTASVSINSATSLTVVPTVTQTACSASTGAIDVVVSGGLAPYTYSWSPISSSASSVSGLPAGVYSIQITDANSCSTNTVILVNSLNGPIVSISKSDIDCSDPCSGIATVTVTGGTPGYSVLWSDGETSNSISALCVGAYSVEVTDAAGCIGVQSVSINTVIPIAFSTPNISDPKCFNDCNGSITAIPSGGALPFTYDWSTTDVTPGISNLCANVYSVTITDANGCVASDTYTLNNPTVVTVSAAVTNPTCSTSPDGAIDITPAGGTPGYTYNWTGSSTAVTEDLTNVFVGTYSVQITDANGCTKDTSITLTASLVVVSIAGNDSTFCQNGSFTLDGSGSIGSTTYQWIELPGNTVVGNTPTISINPATGTNTYVLIASDGSCASNDTIVLTSNALPVVDAGPFVTISVLSTTVIGGSPTCPTGVTYSWSPSGTLDNASGTNPTASNTVTTQYTVTVTDGNGCVNFDTVTVNIYPEIRIVNGFSPNSDGKNDVWIIENIAQFPDCTVEVYNRWGEQLFYSKGYAIPWDGRFKGKDLPVGTYYYVINLNHPNYPKPYTGPVTIFR